MEYELHHGIVIPTNILDREQIIAMLDHSGHGFDDDESTITLCQKMISDMAQGIIPAY